MNKVLIVMLLLTNLAVARMGSEPPSQRYDILTKQEMELYQLKPVDVPQLLQKNMPKDYDPKPVTFAVGNATNINLKSHGTWTDVPGGQIWNLRFESKNATDINFGFTNFYLPKGVELYFLSFADDPVYYDGPYTSNDNQSYKQFWSAPLPGGDVALELFVPTGVTAQIELDLTKVSTGFRDVFRRYNGDGLIPKQGPCNNDVVCPEGDDWRDDIRSVAAYTMAGTDTCTGTMVMDTARSFTPYFLTADHCGVRDANAATMVTIWNFESVNCGDLSGGSRLDTVSGAIFKATRSGVDFTLVELSSTPPDAFGVYWAGWDSSGAVPTGSVGIHHPGVDEKAISFNTDALTTINSCIGSGGVDSHWEVDNWEDGTTEPGSSGSGLWDPDTKLLVGFLSGGSASCTSITMDCYGKVSEAWDDGSGVASNLKPWLDSGNTGLTSIAGSDPSPFGLTVDDMTIEVCNADTAVGSTVNVTTNGAFTGAVDLTVSTTPAFVSNFAFATTPVDPTPGSSAFTFDVGAGGTTGTHALVLQGDGDDAGMPVTVNVTVNLLYSEGPTTATTLATPVDAATDVHIATTFSWAADANATSYHLMVSDDPTFGTLLIDEFLTDTSFDATGLPGSTELHWKVATISTCDSHVESSVFTFNTVEVFCATPAAIPDNDPTGGVDLTIPVTVGGSLVSLTASVKSGHTWPGDLIFTLTNNGTSVILMDRPGLPPGTVGFGCGMDGVDVVFDDASAIPVETVCEAASPGVAGTLAPEQALSAFVGADFSGDWVLNVTDNAVGDSGSITEFCIVPNMTASDLIFTNGFEAIPVP